MNVDDVVHCPYSCGLSLSHTSGWSLAYTGDAYELSHSFIKNGREFPFSPVGVVNFKFDLNPLSRTVEQVSIHSYEGVRVKLREMFLGFQNFCHHASVIPVFSIAAKNCDILIHEASYEDIYANRRSNNMHRYAILFMYCTGCYAVFT